MLEDIIYLIYHNQLNKSYNSHQKISNLIYMALAPLELEQKFKSETKIINITHYLII